MKLYSFRGAILGNKMLLTKEEQKHHLKLLAVNPICFNPWLKNVNFYLFMMGLYNLVHILQLHLLQLLTTIDFLPFEIPQIFDSLVVLYMLHTIDIIGLFGSLFCFHFVIYQVIHVGNTTFKLLLHTLA